MANISLAKTLRATIDPMFGIANRLVELPANMLAPDVFVSLVDGGPPAYFLDHRHAAWFNCSNGSGAAFSREGALWATIGEMLERYCASIYDRMTFKHCSGASLGDAALPIDDMILFSEAQYQSPNFPFAAYNLAQETMWQQGENLATGAPVFAPAQLLYLSHEWAGNMLMQTVSTGLGCHTDPELARLSALLELIERDGFAAAWLLDMPFPRLKLTDQDRANLSPETLRALDNPNLQLTLHAVPNEFGLANIVAFAEHSRFGFGVVGAAVKLCPYGAIEKAVLEALHGWIGFTQRAFLPEELPTQDTLKTPHDHALLYLRPKVWRTLDKARTKGPSIGLGDVTAGKRLQSSQELVAALAASGFPTYLFDLTTEDVRQLGFQTVRAIVPGLQPLSFGKTPISEDRRRLTQLAAFWSVPMPEHLNTRPHPFP